MINHEPDRIDSRFDQDHHRFSKTGKPQSNPDYMKLKFAISLTLLGLLAGIGAFSQTPQKTEAVQPVSLSGPRFGITVIGRGELTDDLKSTWGVNPVITQFGWQFESRLFTTPSGLSGLAEWVLLAGGLEQNVFLPSASMLVGIRGSSGAEFGFGPNISLAGAAFAFAAGVTVQSSNINFPINLAVVPSARGTRVSLLVGINTQKR